LKHCLKSLHSITSIDMHVYYF